MPNRLISIGKLDGIWNGSRMSYFSCQVNDRMKVGNETNSLRCGGEAGYILVFMGEASERIQSLHLCERHARPYLGPVSETATEFQLNYRLPKSETELTVIDLNYWVNRVVLRLAGNVEGWRYIIPDDQLHATFVKVTGIEDGL